MAQAGSSAHEREPEDAGGSDAGTTDPDLNTYVATLLAEYAREVKVTCPCRVADDSFSSLEECTRMLGGDALSYIDCATRVLQPVDTPELRAWIRCRIEDYQTRTDCLDAHSCAPSETNACYEMMKDCPQIDAQALTPLIYSCVGLFGTRM